MNHRVANCVSSLPILHNPEKPAMAMSRKDLKKLVETHQALLSENRIIAAVEAIPPRLHDTLEYRLLAAMVYYHQQHQATQPDWRGTWERFEKLQSDARMEKWALLRFYCHNYGFLSLRNADGAGRELNRLFQAARLAAEKVPAPRKHQLLGFLFFNQARLLLKQGENKEAFDNYSEAELHRILFYYYLRERCADEPELKAAATQVWKLRQDWPTYFPQVDIEFCLVSEQLFAEVAPLADPSFSATKK